MKIKNCLLCLFAIVISCTAVGCQDKKPADSGSEPVVTEQNAGTAVQDDSVSDVNPSEISQPNPTDPPTEPVINEFGEQELGGDVTSNDTASKENGSSDNPSADANADSRSDINVQNENVNVEGNLNENGEQELGGDVPENQNSNEEVINPTDEEGNEEL